MIILSVLVVMFGNKCHIHDLTVSIPFFGLDLGVKVSGRDPLECKASGVLMKQGHI